MTGDTNYKIFWMTLYRVLCGQGMHTRTAETLTDKVTKFVAEANRLRGDPTQLKKWLEKNIPALHTALAILPAPSPTAPAPSPP